MYEGNAIMAGQHEAKQVIMEARPKTMRENIDRQIDSCETQMKRLLELKAKLEAGASLLDIDMSDLRQAMNY